MVVEGQEVIRQMSQLPTHPQNHEYGYFFQTPVEILVARMVESNYKQANAAARNTVQGNGATAANNNQANKKLPRASRTATMDKEQKEAKPADPARATRQAARAETAGKMQTKPAAVKLW